jgi:hypothetical protein
VRVREYTFVEPEQVTPDGVSEDDWSRFHLVLFGSIVNNPAVLRLYARHRCFTDAHYPGRGGAEIRTVVNPLGTGKNVLLVGGTDFPSVEDAAIALNRSFREVTFEEGGVLALHRLNFCISAVNCPWRPGEREVDAHVARVLSDERHWLDRAADVGLYHYQTEDAGWARVFHGAMSAAHERPMPVDAAWKFALTWTLIHSSPAFDDAFRLATDRRLLSLGEAAADQWRPPAAHEPRDALTTLHALALHRVDAHFQHLYGERPLLRCATAVQSTFDADESAFRRADGRRDWLATDQWASYLLETERYAPLEAGAFHRLAEEAAAEAGRRPCARRVDAESARHTANVMLKAAAFHDDGRFLGLRRQLLGDMPEMDYPPDGPTSAWNWYTGAYYPDLLPVPPEPLHPPAD